MPDLLDAVVSVYPPNDALVVQRTFTYDLNGTAFPPTVVTPLSATSILIPSIPPGDKVDVTLHDYDPAGVILDSIPFSFTTPIFAAPKPPYAVTFKAKSGP